MKKKLAMDYEKKYKEALERAKKLRDNANGLVLQKWCENVFPELGESDERIRKEIIAFLKENLETGRAEETWSISGLERWIAWLEKQGEKQQKTPIWKHWKNGIAGNGEGKLIYLVKHGYTYSLSSCLGSECDYIELSELDKLLSEEQGEQKPADTVEPKFKKGVWCIDNEDGTIFQIMKVLDNTYTYKTIEGKEYSCTHYSLENDARLWTIQDVKDGDVLYYRGEISLYKHDIKNCTKQETTFGGFVYHCCYDGKRFIINSLYSLTEQDKMYIHPATKEQCETLEMAITNAGYIWYAKKKELKEIVQKPTDEETMMCPYCKSNDIMIVYQDFESGYGEYHCNNCKRNNYGIRK